MDMTVVGNFAVTQNNVYPNFQHTGTWYDYFTGDSITVTNATAPISFAPGEWHIYTDVKLSDAAFMDLPEEVLAEVKPFMAFSNTSQGTMDLLLDFAEGTRVQWSLVDLNGRVAAQGEIQSEGPMIEPMDFSDLAKGMYLLNLTTPERHYTERVVLQ